MSTAAQAIDQAKLDEFMGRFVGDLGAAMSAALVVIGDRLGLYRVMADGEPLGAQAGEQRLGEVVTAGGISAYGNSTHDWDLSHPDHPNPEYR
jgi:hypothetical protein